MANEKESISFPVEKAPTPAVKSEHGTPQPGITQNDVHHGADAKKAISRAVRINELRVEASHTFATSIYKTIRDHAPHIDECKGWMNELQPIVQPEKKPEIRVGLYGQMGTGKSELINALIHKQLLSCSAWQVSTAVVTEVCWNDEADDYRATVEFITPEQWLKELQDFLNDNSDAGNVYDERDLDSASRPTWHKLRSVCPELAIAEAVELDGGLSTADAIEKKASMLLEMGSVRKFLGGTKTLKHTSLEQFRNLLDQYVSAAGLPASEADGGECTVFWPFISLVRIKIRAQVLKDGVILVDLPGFGDVDAARGSVAENYMTKVDKIWVVASITRGKDEKVARQLLDPSFQRQLKMDGRYNDNFVSLILTKTDDISPTRIIDDARKSKDPQFLGYLERKSELSAAIKSCEAKIKKATKDIAALRKEMKPLAEEKEELVSDALIPQKRTAKASREDAHVSKKQRGAKGKPNPTQSSQPAEEISIGAGLSLEDQSKLQDIAARQDRLIASWDACKATREKAKKEMADCKKLLKHAELVLVKLAIHVRNIWASEGARRDFREGYRLFEESLLEDDDEQDRKYNVLESKVEDLRVFTVSSIAYMKMNRLLEHDSISTAGFMSPQDTCIPQLRSYCKEITWTQRKNVADTILERLQPLKSEMTRWTANKGAAEMVSKSAKESLENLLEKKIQGLQKDFAEASEDTDKKYRNLMQLFNPVFNKCINHAANAEIAARWRDIRMSVLTRRAVCKRNGAFTSKSTSVTYDWNKDLTEAFLAPCVRLWDRVFNRDLVELTLAHFRILQKELNDFAADFKKEALPIDENFAREIPLVLVGFTDRCEHLRTDVISAKDRAIRKSMSVHRIVTPQIERDMTFIYQKCAREKGKGCGLRMGALLVEFVPKKGVTVFKDVKEALQEKMTENGKIFTVDLQLVHKNTIEGVRSIIVTKLNPDGEGKKFSRKLQKMREKLSVFLSAALGRLEAEWVEADAKLKDEEEEPEPQPDADTNDSNVESDDCDDASSELDETMDDAEYSKESQDEIVDDGSLGEDSKDGKNLARHETVNTPKVDGQAESERKHGAGNDVTSPEADDDKAHVSGHAFAPSQLPETPGQPKEPVEDHQPATALAAAAEDVDVDKETE